ncbi:MAG: SurA N-terminal domain-containing protein [Bacteroidales bacterium]|nr:SurA N-terminal domain-containing protein [Bacteroidales bacterium]
MAAIGAIRKHGILLLIIIGVALLAFLLGDMTKVLDMFSDRNTMVKINGTKYNEEYQKEFQQNLALWKIIYDKSSLEETENYQVHEMTWQQLLEDKLLDKELKKLGLIFSDEMKTAANEQLIASLNTQQPNQLLYKLFSVIAQNSSPETAYGFLTNIEEYSNQPNVSDYYDAYKAIERFNISDKKRMYYYGMVQGAQNFSDVMVQKIAKDNKGAMVQLAIVNPNMPAFSSLLPDVNEKDAKAFFKANKNRYKYTQEMRDIDVAVLPIGPSNADLKTIEDSVRASYARFVAAESIEAFNKAEMKGAVDSTYFKRDAITLAGLDSLIFDVPVGSFIEPYNYENRAWYYGKVFGSAYRPDSIQIAYLVVDYKTKQNQQSARTKKQARQEADSLKRVLMADPNAMFSLLPSYLAGRNAKDRTEWISDYPQVRTLHDSLLYYTAKGQMYVQKNKGYFVVFQVRQMTKPIEKRMFAIYPTEIKASDETVNSIQNAANQLAAASTSAEKFLEVANQSGIQVVRGDNVTAMAAVIGQFPNCRDIVTWAFNENTKKDAISDVIKIDNQYFTVSALRNIKAKGKADFDDISGMIEAELKAEKKIEMVEKQLNDEVAKGADIATLAAKYNAPARDSIRLGFALDMYQNAQVEDAAVGKIFALSADNKTHVVSGKNAVYLVAIHNMDETTPSPNFTYEKMMLQNIVGGRARSEATIMEGLKEKADIFDNRCRFYQK